MQDDEMDMRIRDAANQHHPPYDDKAWEKMEQLLDQHLPQKKDRKKWFFFLLLFLLLDTVILLFIIKPGKTNTPALAANNLSKSTPSASQGTVTSSSNTGNTAGINETGIEQPQNQQTHSSVVTQPISNNSNALPVTAKSSASFTNQDALTPSGKQKTVYKNKDRFSTNITTPGTASDVNTDLEAKKQFDLKNDDSKTKTTVTNADRLNASSNKVAAISNPDNSAKTIAKDDQLNSKKNIAPGNNKDEKIKVEEKATSPSKDKKKTPKGFGSNFGLTVSVGAELNYVTLDHPGKTTLLYGAGLSYTVAKRFTVRAGFYVSKKVYAATPAEYNNTIYPDLNLIKANCKVYQLPLSISYNFGQRKNHSWFGGVGISSLLMKKEAYNYEYKTPAGQYYYYNHSVDNENKHYFSVLSFSAGYQYNLNDHFSLMAEPFYNMPLKGIGYGKIKLNSAGALLTVKIKPFAKKNK